MTIVLPTHIYKILAKLKSQRFSWKFFVSLFVPFSYQVEGTPSTIINLRERAWPIIMNKFAALVLNTTIILSLFYLDNFLGGGVLKLFKRLTCTFICFVKKSLREEIKNQGDFDQSLNLPVLAIEVMVLSLSMVVSYFLNLYKFSNFCWGANTEITKSAFPWSNKNYFKTICMELLMFFSWFQIWPHK